MRDFATLSINAMAEGQDGQIWIGTDKGLKKLNDTSVVDITWKTMSPNSVVSSVLFDQNQAVWVGTGEGLYVARRGAYQTGVRKYVSSPEKTSGRSAGINSAPCGLAREQTGSSGVWMEK